MNRTVNSIVLVLVIILGISFTSCSTKKKLLRRSELKELNTDLIDQVRETEIKYNSIELKLSTKTDAFGSNYLFNITYRNQKDSIIWISARAMLGIEAARIICNRDSVWIISRIARIEEKGSWDKMTELVGYPLDFNTLQGIFSRKLFVPSDDDQYLSRYTVKKTDKGVLLAPDFNDKKQRELIREYGFMPQFLLAPGQKRLYRTRLIPEDNTWQMDCLYGESAVEQFFGLPESLKILAIDENNKLAFDLKVLKVNLNTDLKFTFPWF